MRISTSMMHDTGTQNLLQLQSGLYRLQNQLSTGRRILTPADDPVAAAQALVVGQRQSVNQLFMDNQANAASQLTTLEDRLSGISDLVQAVKGRAVEAGNATYSDSDRRTIAAEIRERFDELLGLANSSDAMGAHVFAGFRSETQPFSVSGPPGQRSINYAGDDGRRQLQVETDRMMDVSDSGADVFMRIPQGNGTFTFAAGTANAGTGIAGAASIISGFDGSTFELKFEPPVAPATTSTTYQLTVTPPGGAAVVTTAQPYVAGQDIVLGSGAAQFKVSLSGVPVAGDIFKVAPAANQSIFKTLDDMIRVLEGSVSASPVARAAFQNQMTVISENLDQAMDHLLSKQTSIGARRIELDALSSVGSDLDLQHQADLSRLQDLDYTQAISSMVNQKMVLEAAQLSFKQVSQLSLFNYL